MNRLQFSNGDRMPILGLGTWESKPGEAYKAVKEAILLGYRHIDCAPAYGNEPEIGQALSESFEEGVVTRDQMWITSKLRNNAHAPEDVEPALDKSLSDLQLSYLDLYLIHWPVSYKRGVLLPKSAAEMIPLDVLPISKTWEAMEITMDKRLCRHIGVCNFSIVKLRQLLDGARLKPEMNQIELHPYLQQSSILDFCGKNRVHVTAYSPLGSPGRPLAMRSENEPVLLEDLTITKIAARREVTKAQALIVWAIHRGTAVIPKSVNMARMKENLDATKLSLTEEDMQEIAGIDMNRHYIDVKPFVFDGGSYTKANIWDE
jgi:alcohol dehydrogenase (NADP+)